MCIESEPEERQCSGAVVASSCSRAGRFRHCHCGCLAIAAAVAVRPRRHAAAAELGRHLLQLYLRSLRPQIPPKYSMLPGAALSCSGQGSRAFAEREISDKHQPNVLVRRSVYPLTEHATGTQEWLCTLTLSEVAACAQTCACMMTNRQIASQAEVSLPGSACEASGGISNHAFRQLQGIEGA